MQVKNIRYVHIIEMFGYVMREKHKVPSNTIINMLITSNISTWSMYSILAQSHALIIHDSLRFGCLSAYLIDSLFNKLCLEHRCSVLWVDNQTSGLLITS